MIDIVYIIYSWLPRVGSSMMMECLKYGGLSIFSSEGKEKKMQSRFNKAEYIANENFFELDNYTNLDQYEGKLIKVIGGKYIDLPIDSKIVIMVRDSEEIRQSYESFLESLDGKSYHICNADIFAMRYAKVLKTIKSNKREGDVAFSYREVLESPAKHFQKLADLDWPIDVRKAASKVDSSKCRYKIEKLEYGI